MIKPLLLAFLVAFAAASLVYQKVVVEDAEAKCLDGSQAAYYIYQGDPAKVLIFIEGGGWCGDNDLASTTENCYKRSKTDLGSSTGYQPTQTFGSGILSDHSDNYFNGWTRVFLKYCDGSGHQGSKKDAINYKGATLYFRGQDIKIAQFNSINKSNKIFTNAVTHLVLTGESAGGLAAFQWTNYLAAKLDKNTKFWSIPDSGVFVDEVNSITQ
jgi:O-palmitoleoyl-L-serine hydrolase